MKVFEIVKVVGFNDYGTRESHLFTGLLFKDEQKAKAMAHQLWLDDTTAEQRSAWCDLHYIVKEVEIIYR